MIFRNLFKRFWVGAGLIIVFGLIIAFPSCLLAGGLTWQKSVIGEITPHLSIVTTADLQSNIFGHEVDSDPSGQPEIIGGMDRIASLAHRVRSQVDGELLVSTGDDLMGAFYATFGGVPEIISMNMAGYDVVVPGNHEFDQGVEVYAKAAAYANFDIVAANLDVSGTDLENIIKPGVIKVVDGVSVGIFGLITPALKSVCNVGDSISVDGDLSGVAAKMVNSLRAQGAQIVIALSHCGTVLDRQTASTTSGLDLIVGGHSHEYIYETVTRPDGKPCILVQAGAGGTRAGVLKFSFQGNISDPQWQLVDLDEKVGSDTSIKTYVDQYVSKFNQLLGNPIGQTLVALDSRKSSVREGESNLGDLICDSIIAWFDHNGTDNAIAMINGGAIRGDRLFPAGDISRKDVLTILPFPNTIIKVEMTGKEIWEALEASASSLVEPGDGCDQDSRVSSGGFLQLSHGIKVTIDPSKEPFCAKYDGRNVEEIYNNGNRIVSIEVLNNNQWEPIVPSKTYTVYINSWLAEGGDGNYIFNDKNLKKEDTTVLTSDILASYITKNSPINPVVDGRIVIVP